MLYLACTLTVIIETAIFISLGYSKKQHFVVLCVATNVATNLIINLLLRVYSEMLVVVISEFAVVIAEYLIYATAIGHSKGLMIHTTTANVVSYATGVLLFGI